MKVAHLLYVQTALRLGYIGRTLSVDSFPEPVKSADTLMEGSYAPADSSAGSSTANPDPGSAAAMTPSRLAELHTAARSLSENIGSVVLGKLAQARLCLVALFAAEHVLMEDVPGVGKTLLGKALARSVSGDFSRIQFTPDLLPGDILGSSVYDAANSSFVFHRGAIFNNFVLADEINRAPPRTQSALLEAMSDRQVSIDGTTYDLPRPFMVIATQNPFEFEGTYVLPESQLDRFLVRFLMGYPERSVESEILTSHRAGQPVDDLQSVCSWENVFDIQNAVRQVSVEDSIAEYMLDVVTETRESSELSVGVSTRGALAWYSATRAMAFIQGRDYAVPDDARDLAVAVLAHRVQATGIMQGTQRTHVESIIKEIVSHVPLPT